MRDRFGLGGRLTIIRIDRTSGKISEKRVVKNALTYFGSYFILDCMYDPTINIDMGKKMNKLLLLAANYTVIKSITNPSRSEYCRSQICNIDLIWYDNSHDSYVVSYIGLTSIDYRVPDVVSPDYDVAHFVKLSSPLEKPSLDAMIFRWSITLPYTSFGGV